VADSTNRLSDVDGKLQRDSLVGSYFHSDHARGWQGCVVAEPAAGVYLVETFGWLGGDSTHQELVRIDEMFGWQFYDTADWMKNSYEHGGLAEKWTKMREGQEAAGE
jgi:hypothetical protein